MGFVSSVSPLWSITDTRASSTRVTGLRF
jgi:hypothetical protein